MRWWPILPAVALALLFCPVGQARAADEPRFSNAEPVLQEIAKQLQDQSLPEAERLAIVKILGDWKAAQVRAPLLATLDDTSPAMRAASARALGWEGNREAVTALRRRLEAPGEVAIVRAAALEALGVIGDASVRDVVLAAAQDQDPAVREAALYSVTFRALGDPADRVPLLRRIAEDRGLNLQTRSEAILSLGALKDTGAADLLMRLLEGEPRHPMPLPGPSPSQQELMLIRYRQTRDVRAWAAKSLGLIEARIAVPLLMKSAEDQGDFFLRLTSLESLVIFNATEALPVLVRRLEDPFPGARVVALEGLSKARDRSVVDKVLARLSDRATDVRAQAVRTLADLGDPRARPPLEALRKTELEADVQLALEAALARLAP